MHPDLLAEAKRVFGDQPDPLLRQYLAWAKPGENPHALVIDAGDGRNLPYLLERGCQITLIDKPPIYSTDPDSAPPAQGASTIRGSPNLLWMCERLSITVLLDNIYDVALYPEEYNVVVASRSLHLIKPDYRAVVCDGIDQTLCAQGWFIGSAISPLAQAKEVLQWRDDLLFNESELGDLLPSLKQVHYSTESDLLPGETADQKLQRLRIEYVGQKV